MASEPNIQLLRHQRKKEVCFLNSTQYRDVIDPARYSSFTRLKRVTAWVLRYLNNSCPQLTRASGPLSAAELSAAETHLISKAQYHSFQAEIDALRDKVPISRASCLRTLHPFLDSSGLLRVGGCLSNSEFAYDQRFPIILHGQTTLKKLVIASEHVRLLHAGPTLVALSLGRRFHIVGQRRIIRTITRACVTCRRTFTRPQPQLPLERVTPGVIFERVGVDYAGPVYLKLGHVRKPTIIKSYICIFVALSVKAVHLELVSDITSTAFIACLRRFIARRGKPCSIWSDHGSNFVGASRELAELSTFLEQQKSKDLISKFCTSQGIEWTYIPEHAPHCGGLWESAVKSAKTHLKRILRDAKLTFEEFSTVLT
jgi:hypothetical protein